MKRLFLFLILMPCVFAGFSDLYNDEITKIDVSSFFYSADIDLNLLDDSVFADIYINNTDVIHADTIAIFDIVQNQTFILHKEFNITKKNTSFNLGRMSAGNYKIILTIFSDISDEIIFKKYYDFSALNFEQRINLSDTSNIFVSLRQVNYKFFDVNNNSLCDYLVVEPEGFIIIYDKYNEFILSTTKNQIDLSLLYEKKAEGPFKIIVDFEGKIFESITKETDYSKFERGILPDLYVSFQNNDPVIKNENEDAFNFFVAIKKGEKLILKKINYLKKNSSLLLNYELSQGDFVFVDYRNDVEEKNEDNNMAEFNKTNSILFEPIFTGETSIQKKSTVFSTSYSSLLNLNEDNNFSFDAENIANEKEKFEEQEINEINKKQINQKLENKEDVKQGIQEHFSSNSNFITGFFASDLPPSKNPQIIVFLFSIIFILGSYVYYNLFLD